MLQLSGADALVMNMDMIHCWMFGLGAYISIMAIIWTMLKFLRLTRCRHVLQSVVKMWDLMMKNFQIRTEIDHHNDHHNRIYICKYGDKFHSNTRCKHITDSSTGELKSSVKRLTICGQCEKLGWDNAGV